MLAEQRRALILEILGEKGSVSVTDLHRRLRVSRETIRRDITRLDSENRLRKTHGGALSFDGVEPTFEERMAVNLDGKRRIGREAAELVPDGASMMIDYGTTTLCLADALVERRRLTVYTNDVHIAARLAGRNDNTVMLLGGELSASENATLGWDTVAMLERYYTDFAFVGAGALSAHPWLTDFSREAAELRGCMLTQARTTVLLADHTKFQRVAPVHVTNLDKVNMLVTDQNPPTPMADGLKSLGLDIIVA